MKLSKIIKYEKAIIEKFKGLRPNEVLREIAITDMLRKQFPMEYRNALKIYVMLLANGLIKQTGNGFVSLTESGYLYQSEENDKILPIHLEVFASMYNDRNKLFYEIWECIGDIDENPYYVKGSDFYNTIKLGIDGLPPTYSKYVSSLPVKPNGLKQSRLDWYHNLFVSLNETQVLAFLENLSSVINRSLNIETIHEEMDDVKYTNELPIRVQSKNMSEEQEIIQKLIAKTKEYAIEWKISDDNFAVCDYSGMQYRVWMDIMPYTESHEYFAYGLEVFHDKWKKIAYEEEDPDTTYLSETGKMLSSLYAISIDERHSVRIKTEINIKKEMEGNKIFIVHGHDKAVRTEVELFITQLGLSPVVLCKQPSKGNTIIEKIEQESESSCYSIVLYTSCDKGHAKEDSDEKPRARQNVVFEHGYMCAKLGRDHVTALVESGVEVPGDLDGVIYITLDEPGAWKMELAKNMRAVGISVDMNKIK